MLKGVARVWFNSESFQTIPTFHLIRVRFHSESKNRILWTRNCPSLANMLKLLFCLRTFTEFYSHFHAFILTKETINNTDCGKGMHFSALVTLMKIPMDQIKYLVLVFYLKMKWMIEVLKS